jgi:hypothetical protein
MWLFSSASYWQEPPGNTDQLMENFHRLFENCIIFSRQLMTMRIMVKYSVKGAVTDIEDAILVTERNRHPKRNLTQNAKALYFQY